MILFKTKKIKELELRIRELNQEIQDIKELNKVFYGEVFEGAWCAYRKHISVSSAIQRLLEHFNIDFECIPSSGESFKVVSTKTKKKESK